ncbi:MAG: zinc-ribbon domain-containing protein [Lachnospiraceae bacterium]|nr:zinc-ribbon domain-containing protein [Lachnospiraceae bacterium]
MQCPKCNANIKDGMRFCTKCGHDLSAAAGNQPSVQKVPPVGGRADIQEFAPGGNQQYEKVMPAENPTNTNVPPVNQYERYPGGQNQSTQTVIFAPGNDPVGPGNIPGGKANGPAAPGYVPGGMPNGPMGPGGTRRGPDGRFYAPDGRVYTPCPDGRYTCSDGQLYILGPYGFVAVQVNNNGGKKKKTGLIVLIACLALLLVCGLGVGAYFLFIKDKGPDDGTEIAKETYSPEATPTMEDYPPVATEAPTPSTEPTSEPTPTPAPEELAINVWSYNDELPGLIESYMTSHPDCDFKVNATIIPYDSDYYGSLDNALGAGGSEQPDIYCVEYEYTPKYVKGYMSDYAMPYADLGLRVNGDMSSDPAKQIAEYTIVDGTNQYGEIVALNYQSPVCLMYYRRSIARAVWGNLPKYASDSSALNARLSSGYNSWSDLIDEGEKLKAKGYAIVSSVGDMWRPYKNISGTPWVVNGQLVVDQYREKFMDDAKKMYDKGYCNKTRQWTDAWYADMKGEGSRPVLVFVGPTWFLNYVMEPESGNTYGDWSAIEAPSDAIWGGEKIFANRYMDSAKTEAVAKIIEWMTLDCTEDGLQYGLASGDLWGKPCYVPSSYVMNQLADGRIDMLGGDDVFETSEWKNAHVKAGIVTEYDSQLDSMWLDEVYEYCEGRKSKQKAMADFKTAATNYINNHR